MTAVTLSLVTPSLGRVTQPLPFSRARQNQLGATKGRVRPCEAPMDMVGSCDAVRSKISLLLALCPCAASSSCKLP